MQDENAYDRSGRKNSVFDKINETLKNKYSIRFNEMSLDYEIRDLKTNEIIEFNESSLLINLSREDITSSMKPLKIYLKSHLVPTFNEIEEYFKTLVWDGKDHIAKYASYVKTDDDNLYKKHLKKWAVRSIKSIFHNDQINKHCIVLANGDQHAGKSTYLKNLCPKPLEKYYAENIGVSKDDRIKLCKTFIINIEEMDILGKNDINSIKSLISQYTVNERLPFGEKATLLYRKTNFTASTNKLEFLTDDTGSVRWILFDVIGRINFDYSKEFDITNFWAQAYHIYKNQPGFKSDLTIEEVQENELRNERYTVQTKEKEYVLKYYDPTNDISYFRTPTDIVNELSILEQRLSSQKIGSSLKKFGFERVKHPKRQVYGYKAKPKFKGNPRNNPEL